MLPGGKKNGASGSGGSGGPSSGVPEKAEDKGIGGGKDDAGETTSLSSKPGSAGASAREAAQRVLVLCQKGEWSPIDQALKSLEKIVAAAGEDGPTAPLLGVSDPVRYSSSSLLLALFFPYNLVF